jgi:RNA polymerase sigma-70 factor (ECF subfamily)
MRTPEVQDTELARRAQEGDREAFGVLVERYAGQARRVARAMLGNQEDADDAAQDGFLAALKHLDRYDLTRPFGPWLMRVVANAASDRRRRRRVRQTQPLSPVAASSEAGPAQFTELRAFLSDLRAALEQLPERQRTAIVLFDVEGYSHREVAEVLQVPEGTVRSDVFHARRTLRKLLVAWKELKE